MNSAYDPSNLSSARLEGANVMRPGEVLSSFICHASEDKPFARKLANDLKANGLEVWLDEWEIKVGDSITGKVDDALAAARFMIVILSRDFLGKPWPMRELRGALMRQAAGNSSYILPVKIDETPLPSLISDVAYADFRGSYDQALETLLAGLFVEQSGVRWP